MEIRILSREKVTTYYVPDAILRPVLASLGDTSQNICHQDKHYFKTPIFIGSCFTPCNGPTLMLTCNRASSIAQDLFYVKMKMIPPHGSQGSLQILLD